MCKKEEIAVEEEEIDLGKEHKEDILKLHSRKRELN